MEIVTKDLTLAILKNLWSVWESIKPTENLPLIQVYHFQDKTRYVTGIPFYMFNGVIKTRMTSQNAVESIRKEIQFFQKMKMPFSWWVDPSTHPVNFEELLVAQGLRPQKTLKAYAKEIKDFAPKSPSQSKIPTEIQWVQSPEQMDVFGDIVGKSKYFSSKVTEDYKNLLISYGLDERSSFKHYIVTIEGIPAGTGSFFITGEVASFWNGYVLPEYQRKGLGTFLTSKLYSESKTAGVKKVFCLLSEATSVQKIYEKLGFQEQFELYLYVPSWGSIN